MGPHSPLIFLFGAAKWHHQIKSGGMRENGKNGKKWINGNFNIWTIKRTFVGHNNGGSIFRSQNHTWDKDYDLFFIFQMPQEEKRL